MNKDIITWVIDTYEQDAIDIIKKIKEIINMIPAIFKLLITICFIMAIAGVLIGYVLSIVHNIKKRKQKNDSHLVYSYCGGTGLYKWKLIYKEAFKYLYGYKWFRFSFAGCAYIVGNFTFESNCINLIVSLLYVILCIFGFVELLIRYIIGTIWIIIFALIHWIILVVLYFINMLVIPIFNMIDSKNRNKQHCPECYCLIDLPDYKCPNCGAIHHDLLPSRCGSLFARCECGKILSASVISGKSGYEGYCPLCNSQLSAANAKQTSIMIIGGNDTGKTAFLAAYTHIALNNGISAKKRHVFGFPEQEIALMEKMFMEGETISSSTEKIGTVSIVHEEGNIPKQNSIVFYDTPDEVILDDAYKDNPLYFDYADGIIITIDPLCMENVRNKCGRKDLYNYSHDDADSLIVNFINQYSRSTGRRADKMVDVPVAVIVNRADINEIRSLIGVSKIGEKADIKNNNARCRQFLFDNGLANAINNLESVFGSVHYFLISAIGHEGGTGECFKPFGVKEVVEWILRKNGR